jgi:hypothetical protein
MKKVVPVILVLAVVFSAGNGFSYERWMSVTTFAWDTFNNTLDLKDRYEAYAEMMRRLYQWDETGRTVYVDPRASGFGDGSSWMNAFHSIQEGLDALDENGGWVWVAEGEYHESIRLNSKTSLFGGFAGVEADLRDRDFSRHPTVLIGDGSQSVVFMEHQTLLDGFTIQNGGGEFGGGVCTGGWLAVIRNNVIRDNHVGWSGGGIGIGGGYWADGAIGKVDGMAPLVERNLIIRNTGQCGSGIVVRYASALFLKNTVANNNGFERSRGIEIIMRPLMEPTLLDNIFWNHKDDVYYQVGSIGTAVFQYNCVKDADFGAGIIHEYPMFADTTAGDFSLMEGSPCIDTGIRNLFPDPDGSRSDMGAYPTFKHEYPTGGKVMIQSVPVDGIPVNVDGAFYLTPTVVSWYPGFYHNVTAAQFLRIDQGTAYVFEGWEDGGNRYRQIQAPSSPMTLTARYRNQFQLEITNKPHGAAVSGDGWYDPLSLATVTAQPVLAEENGTRCRFDGWEGGGAGSYTGSQPTFQVTMSGPIHERLNYIIEYRLDTAMNPDNAEGLRITVDPPGPWYPAGTVVTLRGVSTNPYYRFGNWNRDNPNPDGSLNVTMDAPLGIKGYFLYLPHPPIITGLPDTTLLEDQSLLIPWARLEACIHDDNDPLSTLTMSFSGASHLTFVMDTAAQALRITPASEWNGEETVWVRVTDPTGASSQAEATINVEPVDDVPRPFDLLSPASDAAPLFDGDLIRFTWGESLNVDKNDSIQYHFYIGADKNDLAGSAVADQTTHGTSLNIAPPAAGTYYWSVLASDKNHNPTWANQTNRLKLTTDVEAERTVIPSRFDVSANYPNPFNPETAFEIQLPRDSRVRVLVYDMRGQRIRSVTDAEHRAGIHRVVWDGRNDAGQSVPSGVYSAQILLGDRVFARKLTLTK